MRETIEKNFSVKISPEIYEHEEHMQKFFEGIYTFWLGRIVFVSVIPTFNFDKYKDPSIKVVSQVADINSKDKAAFFKIQTSHTLAIMANNAEAGKLHVYPRLDDDNDSDDIGIYYVTDTQMQIYQREINEMENAEFPSVEELESFYKIDNLREKFDITRLIYNLLSEHPELLSEYERKILCL